MPAVEKAVYILVGLSAVMMLLAGKCKKCGGCCGGDKACDGEQGGGSAVSRRRTQNVILSLKKPPFAKSGVLISYH